MVQNLNHGNFLTNDMKASVFRYVGCFRSVQLYVVIHAQFDARLLADCH